MQVPCDGKVLSCQSSYVRNLQQLHKSRDDNRDDVFVHVWRNQCSNLTLLNIYCDEYVSMCICVSVWRPPSWKNKKLTYLLRGLSDFDKIWHSDAVRPSWPFGSLKCKILKIQDCGCHHLEKLLTMRPTVRTVRNPISKIHHGGRRHFDKSKNRHISATDRITSVYL